MGEVSTPKYLVYKITNTINQKVYVGKSNTNANRWYRHLEIARNKPKNTYHYLHKSINKYGANNFSYEVLEYFNSEAEAYEAERKYIALYSSNNAKYGMNLNSGGLGGTKQNQEVKDKIRNKRLGFKFSEESKKKMSLSHKTQRPKFPKFTDEQIIEMRREHAQMKLDKRKNILPTLMEKYDAARATISFIVSGRNYKHIPLEQAPQLPEGKRVCSKCNECKLIGEFYKSNKTQDGLMSRCIKCDKARPRNRSIK